MADSHRHFQQESKYNNNVFRQPACALTCLIQYIKVWQGGCELQAKAWDSLAMFFEARAQIEIDEFRDYQKALQVKLRSGLCAWFIYCSCLPDASMVAA